MVEAMNQQHRTVAARLWSNDFKAMERRRKGSGERSKTYEKEYKKIDLSIRWWTYRQPPMALTTTSLV